MAKFLITYKIEKIEEQEWEVEEEDMMSALNNARAWEKVFSKNKTEIDGVKTNVTLIKLKSL